MEKNAHQIMAGQYFLKLLIVSSLMLLKTRAQEQPANYTYLEGAVAKGAVCLDGSPPVYVLKKGYGEGSNNWIVFLEGGSWCETVESCEDRSKWVLGSSKRRNELSPNFSNGYLSGNQSFNPEFYNWNRAILGYCDGASFMGDVEEVDPKTGLHYRGRRIFDAIMEELKVKGLKNADNAILTGASAGGMAAILQCDNFRSLLPNVKRVKCISDSGFIFRAKDLPGADLREEKFAGIVQLHGVAKNLPEACTSKMNPGLCFFPENIVGHIKTPLFLIDSVFDSWQVKNNLLPSLAEKREWEACTDEKYYFRFCTEKQLQLVRDFSRNFIDTLQKIEYCPSRGIYVHSRYTHVSGLFKRGWRCSATDDNTLANKTVARAVADWFFDRSPPFQVIDTQQYNIPRLTCGDQNDPDFRYQFNKKCFSTVY